MTRRIAHRARNQGGFTLVELIIASAIGVLLMTGLTSVVFTSYKAWTTASSRVEASSQIRSFQYFAYDDFARSTLPTATGCTISTPCTVQPITLTGLQVGNSQAPAPAPYSVAYTWDGSTFVDRQVGSGPARHAASDVTAFSWYVDGSAPHQTIVIAMTVTVQSYSESQTMQFFPELNP
jgi:prepilin-type N-terminal cleavage/methylation domain-containing protein